LAVFNYEKLFEHVINYFKGRNFRERKKSRNLSD